MILCFGPKQARNHHKKIRQYISDAYNHRPHMITDELLEKSRARDIRRTQKRAEQAGRAFVPGVRKPAGQKSARDCAAAGMPTSHAIASLKEKLDNDATGKLAKKVAELRSTRKGRYVQAEDMALLLGVPQARFVLHCLLLVQDGDLDAVSLPGGMGTLDGYEVREIEGCRARGWTKPAGYKQIRGRWYKVPIADEASQTAQQAEAAAAGAGQVDQDDEDADDDEDEVVEVEEEDEEDDDEEEEEDEEDEEEEEEDEDEDESEESESDEESQDEDEDESEESESDEESQDDEEDEEEDDSQEENDKSEEEEEEVQVSAYEQMRRANIERNNEALARLDVKAVVAKLVSKKKAPKRKRPVEATLPMAPTRTSSRGTKAPGFYAEPEVEQLA
jgi:hypothetical protein